MKPYPEYKDSGVQWLEEIPVIWSVKKLKYITAFQTGWTPPTKNPEYFIGSNVWVTITDLNRKFISDSVQKISDEAVKIARMAITPKGSLMYSFKLSLGKVAFANRDLYTNEAIISIKPQNNIDLNYLYYCLPSQLLKNANENIYGAKILNQELMRNTFLIFSPLPEQKQIAKYLDHKTAKIDSLIEKKKRLIELLKEERTAFINQAVTKGLDPNVPMKDSGIEWLGEIPAHWDSTYIKHIASKDKDSIVDGPFGSSVDVNRDYVEEGVPVIRTVNITDKGFNSENLRYMRYEKFNELKRHAVYPSDIVLSKVGTIGNCCLFPKEYDEGILSTTGSCKISLNRNMAKPLFIVYLFQGMREYFHLLASSNVQPFLNMVTIKNIKIPLPSIKEQADIVKYIEKETTRIDSIISKSEKEIELLQEYRTALISEVVTGKIDVREEKV